MVLQDQKPKGAYMASPQHQEEPQPQEAIVPMISTGWLESLKLKPAENPIRVKWQLEM